MSENEENTEQVEKVDTVNVRVRKGFVYCEDETTRNPNMIHKAGTKLEIPRHRANHTVEILDKPERPAIKGTDPDGDSQHRMIESPTMGESPRNKGRKGRR